MDIMNIKIEIIIDEYLNYINNMEKMNLDLLKIVSDKISGLQKKINSERRTAAV